MRFQVFDCWFESGSMPYAQNHYPFENKKTFEDNFPADFIAEGIDQTRGWFYTLLVLSTALFNKPPFKVTNQDSVRHLKRIESDLTSRILSATASCSLLMGTKCRSARRTILIPLKWFRNTVPMRFDFI